MEEKLKVAILLRGQPRLGNEAGKMFQRIASLYRQSGIDIQVFATVWPSVSKSMVADNPKGLLGRVWNQETVSPKYIQEALSDWKPMRTQILQEKELLHLIEPIIRKQYLEHDSFRPFFNDYVLKNVSNKQSTALLAPSEHGLDLETSLQYQCCLAQYHLGQMYCAGRSFDALESYTEKTGWKPDLVWSSRIDGAGYFSVRQLHAIYNELKCGIPGGSHIHHNNHIKTIKLHINDNVPWVNDYNFWMLYDTAKNILGDIRNNIGDLMTIDKHHLIPPVLGGQIYQHTLWVSVFRKSTVSQLQTNYVEAPPLPLRPIPDLDERVEEFVSLPLNELEDGYRRFIEHLSKTFVYPSNDRRPTAEEIREAYQRLKRS